MSWKSTGLLLLLAGGLFAFIFLVERHLTPTGVQTGAPKPLLTLAPDDVTNIQLRITNQLVLRVERNNNGTWGMVAPLAYPAQTYAIEGLLLTLSEITTPTAIAPDELSASGKTVADFGLDVPQATLTLQHNGRRTELLFGSKTSVGDQVYVQLLNQPSIYLVSSEVLGRLPRHPNDWRDRTLLNFSTLNWDRMEVRAPGRGFGVQLDPTNRFLLTKPIATRADRPKMEALFRNLLSARVQQFVTDDPAADLDAFGLHPPEAELALTLGTNDVAVVQFGKSPTNDPGMVYARRVLHRNIVLVPKSTLEVLQIPANDLRDRHLFSFSTNSVDALTVTGSESFTVRHQGNGMWVVNEPQVGLVDPELMRELFNSMLRLEGTVEKDVVADFAAFGLAPPARQYLLKTTVTNSSGPTNRVVAQLDLSAPQGGKVFVRRGDDSLTAYSIPVADFEALPHAAWQLRDRRVWTFTTNQVVNLTVSQGNVSRTLTRTAAGKWSLAEGSQGVINAGAVEELIYRLGELRAESWVARGEGSRQQYGFIGDGPKLAIELKVAEKPYRLNLELGGATSSQFPYALANIDGQPVVFKFPFKLYLEMVRDLITPMLRASAGNL